MSPDDGMDTLAAVARDAGRGEGTDAFRLLGDQPDAPARTGAPDGPDRGQLVAAARILLEARDAGLGTILFGAMVDDLIPDGPEPAPTAEDGPEPAAGETGDDEPYPELEAAEPDTPDPYDGPGEHGDGTPTGHGPRPRPKSGDETAAFDANAPEEADARTRGQFGARAHDTYYRNLPAFVQGFVAHVFAFQQGTSPVYKWVPDWWAHPQIVFPLDAMWRSYEAARKNPNAMMVFYIQAYGVLDRMLNPDRGVVASLEDANTVTYTKRGEPLPCTPPPADWRRRITAQLAVGDDTDDGADGPARTHERIDDMDERSGR